MEKKDFLQAVRYEAEQYVPVPISDLYIDFVTLPNAGSAKDHIDVLMVAAPRAIVDSYIRLFDLLDLEIESLEISSSAVARSMIPAKLVDKPTLVIDLGSHSADIALFQHDIQLAGSAPVGGDDFTKMLVKTLTVTEQQAKEIKYRFGIGPSGLQPKIMEAISPQLHTITAEVKKVAKFYKDRTEGQHEVESVVLVGGSASMPGLVDFFTSQLNNIPIYVGNPWEALALGKLKQVDQLDSPMYAAALGLAMLNVRKPEGQS
jgi:type IV pilus assembly protein PilM